MYNNVCRGGVCRSVLWRRMLRWVGMVVQVASLASRLRLLRVGVPKRRRWGNLR